jgi:chemotaxis protein methyltransferase CheR
LEARLGLCFPEVRSADLEAGLRAACAEFGFDSAEECVDWLASATLNRAEIETLAGHFTIGETYFFREPDIFAALENIVLPELIQARRATDRRLRFWSAGCSTGEEAYTLAIILRRILPDIADWRITILGTDINAHALRKAEAGIYGKWSFRGPRLVMRKLFFHERSEGQFEIDPSVREMVDFQYLNLAEDTYPSLLTRTTAMDVILCRNVLLYFSPARAAAVTRRFHEALLEGGWLVGGIAEHFQAPDFQRVSVGERAFFRKSSLPVAEERRKQSVLPPLAEELPVPSQRSTWPSRAAPREPAPSPADRAIAAANEGRLQDALSACDEAIHSNKLEPGHHYLRATILTELGNYAEAEAAFRRAVYLDPDFILAHFAMAGLARRMEQPAAGRKHLRNAVALLSELEPDSILPGSDGLTAREFESFLAALETQLANS